MTNDGRGLVAGLRDQVPKPRHPRRSIHHAGSLPRLSEARQIWDHHPVARRELRYDSTPLGCERADPMEENEWSAVAPLQHRGGNTVNFKPPLADRKIRQELLPHRQAPN